MGQLVHFLPPPPIGNHSLGIPLKFVWWLISVVTLVWSRIIWNKPLGMTEGDDLPRLIEVRRPTQHGWPYLTLPLGLDPELCRKGCELSTCIYYCLFPDCEWKVTGSLKLLLWCLHDDWLKPQMWIQANFFFLKLLSQLKEGILS